ncbi:hypothetical protein PAHAL_2G034600 [Panicum hallii]|jgi:hypothetical protein|uniref:Uncharacterized protein n=1 Tax=Panicum hallii TaxID=206008 RepID=A0A2T8KMU8_9POAL|nr:hypothetical protein PAHAL_2G034600 [Panicum hallii]
MLVVYAVAELNAKTKTTIPVHPLASFLPSPVVSCNKKIDVEEREQTSYCVNWAVSLSLNDLSWL